MIKLIIGAVILFSISVRLNAQDLTFLDSIAIPKTNTSLFLRSCYYDHIDDYGESTRKDFENGVDLRKHYFTDDFNILDSIGEIWETDSSNFLGCFCGYDFEIFLYSNDSLIKKMNYVFCCDDFVIDRKHLFLDKDKMTQAIYLMTPIDNKNRFEFIKADWIDY